MLADAPPLDPKTSPQRISLLVVPFFHVSGCCATMIVSIARGSKIVLMRWWVADLAIKLIERERVTVTGGVPTIAWQLAEHSARTSHDLSSLEQITYGGAPASPDLVRKLAEAFPALKPGNSWGPAQGERQGC